MRVMCLLGIKTQTKRGDVRVLKQEADNPGRRLLPSSVSLKHVHFHLHPPCNKHRQDRQAARRDRKELHQPRVAGNSFHRDRGERCRPGHSCPNTGPIRLRLGKRRVGRNIREGEEDGLRGGSGSGGVGGDEQEIRGQGWRRGTCRATVCRWRAGGRRGRHGGEEERR